MFRRGTRMQLNLVVIKASHLWRPRKFIYCLGSISCSSTKNTTRKVRIDHWTTQPPEDEAQRIRFVSQHIHDRRLDSGGGGIKSRSSLSDSSCKSSSTSNSSVSNRPDFASRAATFCCLSSLLAFFINSLSSSSLKNVRPMRILAYYTWLKGDFSRVYKSMIQRLVRMRVPIFAKYLFLTAAYFLFRIKCPPK